MSRINLVLSDELEAKFREEVFHRFGMKKGNIQKAIEEAIEEWIAKEKERRRQK